MQAMGVPENPPEVESHVLDTGVPLYPALHVYVHTKGEGLEAEEKVGAAGGEHAVHEGEDPLKDPVLTLHDRDTTLPKNPGLHVQFHTPRVGPA